MRRVEDSHSLSADRGRVVWFAALVATVCSEGLARKLLPDAPAALFYYSKDAVLLLGVAIFGISSRHLAASRRLLHGFRWIVALAFVWTLAQAFNPSQPSLPLALHGLRSFWLWWLAPPIVATVLRTPAAWRRGSSVLAVVALGVIAYAAIQFASPADAAINAYASYGGEQIVSVATIGTTGRARVSSTFSYLTGFTDFLILVPPVLLGFGTELRARRQRLLSVAAAGACLAAIPLSGSRGPLLFALAGLLLFALSAGLFRTRNGRWSVLGAGAIAAVAFIATPEAVQGLTDRFRGDDTRSRLSEAGQFLPPVALMVNDYPFFGDGTGTQQNARIAFGVHPAWDTEGEPSRLLAEQGAIGYLLIWTTKLGLAVALLRLARRLKVAGRRGMGGSAAALAVFAFVGNSAFDHVWQALFFLGVGLVLAALEDPRGEATSLTMTASRAPPVGRWR